MIHQSLVVDSFVGLLSDIQFVFSFLCRAHVTNGRQYSSACYYPRSKYLYDLIVPSGEATGDQLTCTTMALRLDEPAVKLRSRRFESS